MAKYQFPTGKPARTRYIPLAQDVLDKAEADALASGMTVIGWITYLIQDYAAPQDGPVDDD